ncbi:ATP-binding cassette, subfamily B [Fontibacillus panacisegetis]|uniref:ATP-binding cassette, subfamily B n=1 Tax=Fontibacillus panacisegetis TaxID=670482 RepID=A0A1G7Q0W7_9BACL|nr:ABC transporter ATP-binding protein [Fontibacillus panacisegetis]SDF91569.1 ATP-binding cassette, subfamily B [Fontibacillus panacisegetis]
MLREKKGSRHSFLDMYLWLMTYYRPYLWHLFYIILLSIVVACGELVIPKTINYFIDNILGQKDKRLFAILLGIVIGISILSLISMISRNRKEIYIREKVSFDLQVSILSKVRQLGFPYFEKNSIGHILSIVNTDVFQMQRLYSVNIPDMIKQIIMIIFSCLLAININIELSIVIVFCMSIYYIFSPMISKKFVQYSQIANSKRKEFDKKIYESISMLPDLKVNVAEQWDRKLFLMKLKEYADAMRKSILFSCVRFSFRKFCIDFGIIAIMLFGFWMFKNSRMGIADIVTYLLYYSLAMNAITQLITNINQQQLLLVQAQNIYNLYCNTVVEVDEPTQPIFMDKVKGEITFNNVKFHYGNKTVVHGLNFCIKPGERIAFVGKSGSGKSTILKLIGRFYDPQEGAIFLDGVNIKKLSTATLREQIGYVFQESFLFQTSIKENIRFGRPDATDEEVIHAAKEAFAYDFIQSQPEGFDTHLGERGRTLSGGQIQRICIARMILKNPNIIVLDEATSTLDNYTETEIQLAFNRLFKGRTVICVAHRLATVREFERICLIEDGVILEEGSYEDLISLHGKFYSLVEGSNDKK